MLPAPEPRPGPTGILLSFANLIKSHTIKKVVDVAHRIDNPKLILEPVGFAFRNRVVAFLPARCSTARADRKTSHSPPVRRSGADTFCQSRR